MGQMKRIEIAIRELYEEATETSSIRCTIDQMIAYLRDHDLMQYLPEDARLYIASVSTDNT